MKPVDRQLTFWDSLQRELPPGLKDLSRFLDAIPCDALIDRLRQLRGKGRNDYPVRPMLRLVLAQMYLRHPLVSVLLAELKRNRDLARLLGFEEKQPGRFKIPPAHVVSRFHAALQEKNVEGELVRVFQRTVELLKAEAPGFGAHTALDATDVRTHGHAERKGKEGSEDRPSTDSDASWSVKTKRWANVQGEKREEKQCTFGYKAYLCVDTGIPAIAALWTVTGKTSDQDMALPMLDAAIGNLGQGTMKTCALDKGFDSEDLISGALRRHVAAIVPVRDVPAPLAQQSSEDREIPLSPNSNLVRDRYSGEVACYAPGPITGAVVRREMDYAGFERDRQTHKFRCPLGANASSCSAFSSCHAGSAGKQGRQVRVEFETDVRRFAPVYPRSKHWKRLYNGRSAVERINSYLKEVLRLEDHCLRGKHAISLRVTLAAVTLNVRTLLALRAEKSRAILAKPA